MSRLSFFLALLFFPLLTAAVSSASSSRTVAEYLPAMQSIRLPDGSESIAIRSFLLDGIRTLLVVDPRTLESRLEAAAYCTPVVADRNPNREFPYFRLLDQSTTPPYRLQNQGVTKSTPSRPGWVLTVDMCPSSRSFEEKLFQTLAAVRDDSGAPVPVAIAVTGLWLDRHPKELDWLKEQSAGKRLAITWVNHSDQHPYSPGTPLEKNFLLTPGTDFRQEVFAVERKLLEQGLVPSPFFRFPGLVSSGGLMQELRQLGLIPLGSDAWLAKGEAPHQGSFILVHGNGNEPAGVDRLLKLLKSPEALPFLPLAPAVVSGG